MCHLSYIYIHSIICYLSINQSIYLSIHLSIYLSIHLSIYLSINQSIYLSLYKYIYIPYTYIHLIPDMLSSCIHHKIHVRIAALKCPPQSLSTSASSISEPQIWENTQNTRDHGKGPPQNRLDPSLKSHSKLR